MMQGQDGVDLEINLNGSKSRFEDDDDLDNMVFMFPFLFYFLGLPLCFLRRGRWPRWAYIFIPDLFISYLSTGTLIGQFY